MSARNVAAASYADFQTVLSGETRPGFLWGEAEPIYQKRPVSGSQDKIVEVSTACSNEDLNFHVPYEPCPSGDRFCGQNNPSQGYYNFDINHIFVVTNPAGHSEYIIKFDYYETYGFRPPFNQNSCVLTVTPEENLLSCTPQGDQDRENPVNPEQATNALFSGLKTYHDFATGLRPGECPTEK